MSCGVVAAWSLLCLLPLPSLYMSVEKMDNGTLIKDLVDLDSTEMQSSCASKSFIIAFNFYL